MAITVQRANPYGAVRTAPVVTQGAQPAFNPSQQAFRPTKKLPTSRNAFMKVWR